MNLLRINVEYISSYFTLTDGSVKKCSQCTFDGFPPDFSEQLKLVEQQCMAKLSAAEEIMSFGNILFV